MADPHNAAHALIKATEILAGVSDTPRLDAELLLAHALEIDRSALLLRRTELPEPTNFAALVARRAKHEPVAYIIGQQDFWDLSLKVTPDVLIPRADSETLIEAAITYFRDVPSPHSIVDLGTGSGALILAALSVFPKARGVAIDASQAALDVATINCERNGFRDRAHLLHLSWHQPDWVERLIEANDGQRFDLLLCNPPYVEPGAALAPDVGAYEPSAALFAGEQGLAEYRTLIPQLSALLSVHGVAIFEIGIGQERAVSDFAIAEGFEVESRRDLAGIVRSLLLHKITGG